MIILVDSIAVMRFQSSPFSNEMIKPAAAAAVDRGAASTGSSGTEGTQSSSLSILSSIIDFSQLKVISTNETGLEAILPIDDGVIWHISVNSIPHILYTPTQQDLQRVQSTGEPLYNVNVRKTITDNDISTFTVFFIPYSAIQSSASTSQKDIGSMRDLGTSDSASSSSRTAEEKGSSGQTNGKAEGGGEEGDTIGKANAVRGHVEGVVGILKEWLEDKKSPIFETSAGKSISRYLEIYDKIALGLDAGMFGKEIYDAVKKLQKYDECRKKGLQEFADNNANRAEGYVTEAKMDIVVDFLMKFGSEVMLKVIETGGFLGKTLAYPISKYSGKVFEDIIKDDMSRIEQVSPCVNLSEKLSDEQKEQYQQCLLLLHKNLKNFAMNACLNKKGSSPPLKQFVP